MGNVNIVAFYHPLIGDWELMEKDAEGYRRRIRSAIREEMIHAEVLLRSMAKTLREAAPRLVRLSPNLAEALNEIEGTIRTIDETRLPRLMAYHSSGKAYA